MEVTALAQLTDFLVRLSACADVESFVSTPFEAAVQAYNLNAAERGPKRARHR